MKRVPLFIASILLLNFASARSEVRCMNQTGVGARAYAMGNNVVAYTSDLSSVYWNPAALSFMPVREFQIAVDGLQTESNSDFRGTKQTDKMQRIRLTDVGFLSAIPTTQGGFTWAISFLNPITFDDISTFGERKGNDSLYHRYRTYGGLRLWGGAIGVQVAKNFGVGISASVLTGRERVSQTHIEGFYNAVQGRITDFYDYQDLKITTNFLGYDLRAGLLYNWNDKIRAGLRIEAPQVVNFTEKSNGSYDPDGNDVEEFRFNGKIYSSIRVAGGMSFSLPFITISSEIRSRLPYSYLFPDQDTTGESQAKYSRVGGGLGIEVPLFFIPVVVRGGYSFDQYDLHAYMIKYDGEKVSWSDDDITVAKNQQTITMGLGLITGSVGLEASYGMSIFSLTTKNVLHQDNLQQRFMASLSIRY